MRKVFEWMGDYRCKDDIYDTMPPVVGAVLVNLRRHGTQVGDGSGCLAVVWEEWNDEVMMNYRLRDIHERFSMVWTL
jgi:hypothetical protein